MNRNHNPRLIRGRRSYSLAEIAKIYGIHVHTVHRWTKEGLPVLCRDTKPYLVMGADVREFLKCSSKKRKQPLRADEFFCARCRKPRKSRPEDQLLKLTGRKLGAFEQVIIRGKCEICGAKLNRFSSNRELSKIPAFTESRKGLTGAEDTSVNVDMRKGQDNEGKY